MARGNQRDKAREKNQKEAGALVSLHLYHIFSTIYTFNRSNRRILLTKILLLEKEEQCMIPQPHDFSQPLCALQPHTWIKVFWRRIFTNSNPAPSSSARKSSKRLSCVKSRLKVCTCYIGLASRYWLTQRTWRLIVERSFCKEGCWVCCQEMRMQRHECRDGNQKHWEPPWQWRTDAMMIDGAFATEARPARCNEIDCVALRDKD